MTSRLKPGRTGKKHCLLSGPGEQTDDEGKVGLVLCAAQLDPSLGFRSLLFGLLLALKPLRRQGGKGLWQQTQ